MPNDSVDLLRKDHTQLASNVSAITNIVGDLKTQNAVREERDDNLDKRLDRIEKSIDGLHGIGRWLILAFFGALIAAFVTFLVRGGMHVPPPTP